MVWTDPDGGRVILHGTLPTVVFPNAMRPREHWHGLALLEAPDIVDLWVQEEKDELESQGINLTHGLLSGGAFGKYLEGIHELEDIQGGRFPDPEPRRLQRNADRHERPVFFIVKAHLFLAQPPPKGQSTDLSSASVLAGAWWDMCEWLSNPTLHQRRDRRYAGRIRGALASLREDLGDDATLLIALHMPQRHGILEALSEHPAPEEISSTPTDPVGMEEE
jgi:hypothetical protein